MTFQHFAAAQLMVILERVKYWESLGKTSPITSWLIEGRKLETVTDFILGGSKNLWMVTAAMKLKDASSLGKKL